MHVQPAQTQATANRIACRETELTIKPLATGEEAEVLAFLAARPIHTVIMAGMIYDNGVVSTLNRGTFHACRNSAGELEGVALIGHVTMLETHHDTALRLFAELARQNEYGHVIIGEQERIEQFWNFYSLPGQKARLMCRELLLEQNTIPPVYNPIELRLATLADRELIAPVHAQMAFEESGINPLERDPEGFRRRVARRIELGRVWVVVEGDKIIFKADIQSETREQIYLEGIYTNPDQRGKGIGRRCISQLSRMLLETNDSICVLVNERNPAVKGFYLKTGFELRGFYDTIYVGQ